MAHVSSDIVNLANDPVALFGISNLLELGKSKSMRSISSLFPFPAEAIMHMSDDGVSGAVSDIEYDGKKAGKICHVYKGPCRVGGIHMVRNLRVRNDMCMQYSNGHRLGKYTTMISQMYRERRDDGLDDVEIYTIGNRNLEHCWAVGKEYTAIIAEFRRRVRMLLMPNGIGVPDMADVHEKARAKALSRISKKDEYWTTLPDFRVAKDSMELYNILIDDSDFLAFMHTFKPNQNARVLALWGAYYDAIIQHYGVSTIKAIGCTNIAPWVLENQEPYDPVVTVDISDRPRSATHRITQTVKGSFRTDDIINGRIPKGRYCTDLEIRNAAKFAALPMFSSYKRLNLVRIKCEKLYN